MQKFNMDLLGFIFGLMRFFWMWIGLAHSSYCCQGAVSSSLSVATTMLQHREEEEEEDEKEKEKEKEDDV